LKRLFEDLAGDTMKIPKTKTDFAIWFYCIAIALLASGAVVIVIKLIFWPPCTQSGNICAIDGWTAAGLAGTVLGVAATVLAILGAVAVAAWWVSLNDRVTDQVTQLYDTQKRVISGHVNSLVDDLLDEEQKKMNEQLTNFLNDSKDEVHTNIDKLNQDIGDIVIDGLMAIGAPSLEKWAQRAMEKHMWPQVSLQMATGYLDFIKRELPPTEKLQQQVRDASSKLQKDLKEYSDDKAQNKESSQVAQELIEQTNRFVAQDNDYKQRLSSIFTAWDNGSKWLTLARDDPQIPIPQELEKEFESYCVKVEHLRQESERIKTRTPDYISQLLNILAPVAGLAIGLLLRRHKTNESPGEQPSQLPPSEQGKASEGQQYQDVRQENETA
jgi:hypothetical protein